MIRFIMVLRANPGKAASMLKQLSGLKSNRRVRTLKKYIVFGRYDAAL